MALFVALAPMVLAVPAAAQDAAKPKEAAAGASNPKATVIPKLRMGGSESYVEIYGQINKGVLVFDDGGETLGYIPVDNGNSSSRAGLRIYGSLGNGWSLGGTLEAEWTPYSTDEVTQLNHGDYDWDAALLRKAELYVDFRAAR